MISLIIFFFNDTATTEIYTLSLHDALPIYVGAANGEGERAGDGPEHDHEGGQLDDGREQAEREAEGAGGEEAEVDRKSTRLNSSHANISYAVFCLKKKNKKSSK